MATEVLGSSQGDSELGLALKVHGELSDLIRPATVTSIRASSIWRNLALRWISTLGAIFVIVMVLGSVLGQTIWGTSTSSEQILILAAAGIGSTFFTLNSARPYLRDRTFDPGLQQDYVVRFALGIFAGFILGNMPELFAASKSAGDAGQNNGTPSPSTAFQIGTVTLAFVGGFLPKVVATILTRVGDSLEALFEGGGKERAAADADATVTRQMNALASEIEKAFADKANDSVSTEETRAQVRKIIQKTISQRG